MFMASMLTLRKLKSRISVRFVAESLVKVTLYLNWQSHSERSADKFAY